ERHRRPLRSCYERVPTPLPRRDVLPDQRRAQEGAWGPAAPSTPLKQIFGRELLASVLVTHRVLHWVHVRARSSGAAPSSCTLTLLDGGVRDFLPWPAKSVSAGPGRLRLASPPRTRSTRPRTGRFPRPSRARCSRP